MKQKEHINSKTNSKAAAESGSGVAVLLQTSAFGIRFTSEQSILHQHINNEHAYYKPQEADAGVAVSEGSSKALSAVAFVVGGTRSHGFALSESNS